MLGGCPWLWMRRCSLPYSLGTICAWWYLVLTVGSFGQESAAGDAPTVHDGGNRSAAPWSATGGQETDEEAAHAHERYAESLANIPERNLPAHRAMLRGAELYVREHQNRATYASSTPLAPGQSSHNNSNGTPKAIRASISGRVAITVGEINI